MGIRYKIIYSVDPIFIYFSFLGFNLRELFSALLLFSVLLFGLKKLGYSRYTSKLKSLALTAIYFLEEVVDDYFCKSKLLFSLKLLDLISSTFSYSYSFFYSSTTYFFSYFSVFSTGLAGFYFSSSSLLVFYLVSVFLFLSEAGYEALYMGLFCDF